MATAKIIGTDQMVLKNPDDYLQGDSSVAYPFAYDESLFLENTIDSSLFEFDENDAAQNIFSVLKSLFKSKKEVVISTSSPIDDDGTPLVDYTQTKILFNSDGTFTIYNPDFEKLSKGESADVVFRYIISDSGTKEGNASLSVREVTMEITGTNEAPVIIAEENQNVAEDYILNGQVVATDIDSDDDSDSLTYELVEGKDIPGFSFDKYGSYSLDANALYQHLKEGEVIEYTFSWQAEDYHGAKSAVNDVNITITGSNDAPVIVVHEDRGVDEGNYISGQVAATDIDSDDDSDSLTYELVEGKDIPGFSFDKYGSYSLDAGIDDYQYLARDETVEYTFRWQAKDSHGALSSVDRVTITITGTNDLPVVAYTELTATVTEMIEPVGSLTDTGTIKFSDSNLDDTHTIKSITASAGALGTLNASVVSDTLGTGTGGRIVWDYSVAASQLEFLAQNEDKVEEFVLILDDGNGGLVDRTVVVTMTGTNDIPVMVVHEDRNVDEDDTISGQVIATDIDSDDDSDLLTYVLVEGDDTPEFTFDSNGSYKFDTGIDTYQNLAKGETTEYTFSWKAEDSHGAQSSVDDVKITITGTNDAPIVTSPLTTYTFNLLEGASDVDHGAILHVENVIEFNATEGWSVQGNTMSIDSVLYQELFEADETETFSFTYDIVDEHGASITQSSNFTIEGKALPTLSVTTSAGSNANIVKLEITSEPFEGEELNLSFGSLPNGAKVLNASSTDITAGVTNYSGTQMFELILPENQDFNGNFSVIVTGETGAQNVKPVELIFDTESSTKELVSFYSNNQNMWGEFDGYIGWHEYVPFLGDAPIIWNEETQVWDNNQDAEYWRSGEFNIVNVNLDSDKIYAAALQLPQDVVDLAILAQTEAATLLQIAKDWYADASAKLGHVTDVALAWADYWIADAALTVAQGAYDVGVGVFNIAEDAFEVAEDAFEWLQVAYDSAYTTWYNSNQAYLDSGWTDWFGTTWYDPIKAAKAAADWLVKGAAWTALEGGKPIYETALSVFNKAEDAFDDLGDILDAKEAVVLAKYADATDLENAMHTDDYYTDRSFDEGDAVHAGDVTLAAGETATAALSVEGAELVKVAADGAVWAAEGSYQVAYDTIDAAITAAGLDFSAQLQIEADLFASVGLQIDFELDLGSVDIGDSTGEDPDVGLDYKLTSLTQYNQTTDMLSITPMMTNMTSDESVAFSTISPNATFYAALLYDVGADLSVFFDGDLSGWYFDFTTGQFKNGLIFDIPATTIDLTLGTNTWNDMLSLLNPGTYVTTEDPDPNDGVAPVMVQDIGVGKLVLIDFDSTEGGPYEVPFIEQLTKDIVSIELDLPVIETQGTAAEFSMDYYDEGGFVNFDLAEITDGFLNLIHAKLDYSEELKELYGLPSLGESASFDELVASMATGFMDKLWDIISDGKSEGVPVFILDTSDESSTSLLHFNFFDFNSNHLFDATPYDYTSEIDEVTTGSLGFYAAYGESDPIIKVNIDIDAAVALIANEVIKAVIIAATAGGGTALQAIPTINPLNLEFGIEQVLKMASVDKTTTDAITDYINLGIGFEMADLDVYAAADFSQEFTLSIDDMVYSITLEDGSIYEFTANGAGDLLIENASDHDTNDDGAIDYSLSIIPDAMFSNDTEIGMSVGYVLDFLKAEFKAGVKLPLDQLLGIDTSGGDSSGDSGGDSDSGWPDIEIPGIDIGVGPLLEIKGDFDVVDFDVYEARFDMDVGSGEYEGRVNIDLVGVDTTLNDDMLAG